MQTALLTFLSRAYLIKRVETLFSIPLMILPRSALSQKALHRECPDREVKEMLSDSGIRCLNSSINIKMKSLQHLFEGNDLKYKYLLMLGSVHKYGHCIWKKVHHLIKFFQ